VKQTQKVKIFDLSKLIDDEWIHKSPHEGVPLSMLMSDAISLMSISEARQLRRKLKRREKKK